MSENQETFLKKMTQGAVIRGGVVAGVIAAGVCGMLFLERVLGMTLDKPAMPLRQQLSVIPRELGFPTRYTASGPDRTMDAETVAVLGTKDYLLRDYRDITKRGGELGEIVSLNINYYSKGDSTPHVPEICWAGSGLKEATHLRRTFYVDGVKAKDGTTRRIPMRMISFYPRGQTSEILSLSKEPASKNLFKNVAYTFEVNGEFVATTKEVVSTFWKADYKYAYYSKIEVTVDRLSDPVEAEAAVGDFIREALYKVEECLPDAKLLRDEQAKELKKAASQP